MKIGAVDGQVILVPEEEALTCLRSGLNQICRQVWSREAAPVVSGLASIRLLHARETCQSFSGAAYNLGSY